MNHEIGFAPTAVPVARAALDLPMPGGPESSRDGFCSRREAKVEKDGEGGEGCGGGMFSGWSGSPVWHGCADIRCLLKHFDEYKRRPKQE